MRSDCVIESCTDLGQARRLRLELGLGEIPQDRLHDVGAARRAAPAGFSSWTTLFSAAATWRAALSVASEDRKYVSTPSEADYAMRVGVNRHEQIGALAVGEAGAVAQRDEVVGVAREEHLDAEALLHAASPRAG